MGHFRGYRWPPLRGRGMGHLRGYRWPPLRFRWAIGGVENYVRVMGCASPKWDNTLEAKSPLGTSPELWICFGVAGYARRVKLERSRGLSVSKNLFVG